MKGLNVGYNTHLFQFLQSTLFVIEPYLLQVKRQKKGALIPDSHTAFQNMSSLKMDQVSDIRAIVADDLNYSLLATPYSLNILFINPCFFSTSSSRFEIATKSFLV